ncbi:MAG: alpha/beta fold hydrolase [Acidimicrobiales bacterium]
MAASVESPVSIPSGDTWTAYTFVDDPVMDDQFKHHLSMMLYGMADLGECLEVGRRIVADDMESWIGAWSTMAQRLQTRAETFEAKGNRVSAASSYLRAATYWRASLMHFGPPSDPREEEHTKVSYHCYDRYLELSGYPGEYVEVPYEGSVLPAYFYRSAQAQGPAPTLIFHQGRDAWPDDTRWVYDSAMQRGIHCLALHGPGQGLSIRLYGHPFRHDWEQAITPAVDRVLEIDGVDPDRIGLMGASFGGYLAPRAAAFEKRLTFCIANPGVLDWGSSIKAAFPPELLDALDAGPEAFNAAMEMVIGLSPTHAWFMEDSMWKHGVSNPYDLMKAFEACDLTPHADKIECPTLVMDGTQEAFSTGQAKPLYDALSCEKEYLLFDDESTAQLHCQNGANATAAEFLFDWLDGVL